MGVLTWDARSLDYGSCSKCSQHLSPKVDMREPLWHLGTYHRTTWTFWADFPEVSCCPLGLELALL